MDMKEKIEAIIEEIKKNPNIKEELKQLASERNDGGP